MADLLSSLVKYLGTPLILQTFSQISNWNEAYGLSQSLHAHFFHLSLFLHLFLSFSLDSNMDRVNFLKFEMRNSSGSFQRWSFGKLTISQL